MVLQDHQVLAETQARRDLQDLKDNLGQEEAQDCQVPAEQLVTPEPLAPSVPLDLWVHLAQ